MTFLFLDTGIQLEMHHGDVRRFAGLHVGLCTDTVDERSGEFG